jgi:uncharacterized Fe-S cluster-containing MiaB family protein
MSTPIPLAYAEEPNVWAIRRARGARSVVDPTRPAAFFCEPEASAQGKVEQVATLFLVNRECPFTCIYCDLWKQTTVTAVSVGEILGQIDLALAALPAARHIKLYNAGNFFDQQAIPVEAWPGIAERVCGFETVIVENHPQLLGEGCLRFRDLLHEAWARGPVAQSPRAAKFRSSGPSEKWSQHQRSRHEPVQQESDAGSAGRDGMPIARYPQRNSALERSQASIEAASQSTSGTQAVHLPFAPPDREWLEHKVGIVSPEGLAWPAQPPALEVAMGLETIHPEVWPRLNKQMTPEDFRRGVEFLRKEEIEARAFVLLQPPYLPAGEAVEWALRSVEFAFDAGVRVVAVIPTRGGNGWLEQLAARGEFFPPTLAQLVEVLRRGLALRRGRVFVDLWDAERLSPGGLDAVFQIELLKRWNLTQGC